MIQLCSNKEGAKTKKTVLCKTKDGPFFSRRLRGYRNFLSLIFFKNEDRGAFRDWIAAGEDALAMTIRKRVDFPES